VKEQNGWRIITDSSIIIDLSTCRYPRDIRFKLQEAFGFPENYGANWSAFWDYLDDFCGDIESLTTVSVIGLDKLGQDLHHYAKKMLEIMRRAESDYPKVRFLFKSPCSESCATMNKS